MIKLSEYAKRNNICYMTAYRHYNAGILKGKKLETGTILIEDDCVGKSKIKNFGNRVILYARVSSSENKDNLNRQMERLKDYSSAKGYFVEKEIKEIGSGINDKRKYLENILVQTDNWDKIIVEHKDRLARFGINYIEVLLKHLNKEIEIINNCDTEKEDIMQDFVSIITSFCAKIYGLRRSKRKTEFLIKELTENK